MLLHGVQWTSYQVGIARRSWRWKVRHYNMVGKDIIWRWKRQPVVKIRLDINWRERSWNLTAFVSNMGGDSNIIYRLSISTIYIYAWRHSWMPVFSFFSLLISYRSLLLYMFLLPLSVTCCGVSLQMYEINEGIPTNTWIFKNHF